MYILPGRLGCNLELMTANVKSLPSWLPSIRSAQSETFTFWYYILGIIMLNDESNAIQKKKTTTVNLWSMLEIATSWDMFSPFSTRWNLLTF